MAKKGKKHVQGEVSGTVRIINAEVRCDGCASAVNAHLLRPVGLVEKRLAAGLRPVPEMLWKVTDFLRDAIFMFNWFANRDY